MSEDDEARRIASELTRKRQRRSALKNHAHKLSKNIETACSSFDPEDGVKIRELRGMKNNFEQQISRIDEITDEILDLVSEAEVEKEQTQFLEDNDQFYYG